MMKTFNTLCALSIICATASAQIHSYVDANGNTIYTDNPPKGQETKVLDIETNPSSPKEIESPATHQKTIRLSPQTPINANSPSYNNDSTRKVSIEYERLVIVSPKSKETIINASGQLIVKAESTPALQDNHKYRFLIDNNVMQETTSPVASLENIVRGEHNLLVEIIDERNEVIKQSEKVSFYTRQTTLADKRRVNPCKFKDFGNRPECPLKDKPPPSSLLRKVTDKLGLTVKCDLPDYGVKKGCPLENKPKTKK